MIRTRRKLGYTLAPLSPGQIIVNPGVVQTIPGATNPYTANAANAAFQAQETMTATAPSQPAAPAAPAYVPPAPAVTPASPTAISTLPGQAQLSAEEMAGNYYYTADIELVQNQLSLYGDTWDSAQSIVNGLYAGGVQPGTVSISMALNAMTGVSSVPGSTTTVSTPSILTNITSWPWYYWAGAAGAAVFLLGGKKR